MAQPHSTVLFVGVDTTLLDNAAIQRDRKDHPEGVYGLGRRVRYWKTLEDLFQELDYRDYLGTLQRHRLEHPLDVELLSMSPILVDHPFADRLLQGALAVLKRLASF